MKKLRTAVVGVGYLGRFHAQKYKSIEQCELVAVCDVNKEQAEKVAAELGVKALTDYTQLIGQVDAVTIAATTSMHYEITKYFLEKNVHVQVEKPMTATVEQGKELCALAKAHNLKLQVGHIERFNPALLSAQEKFKKPLFIECHRLAPFKPRGADVNVVLDLMIHDIDIILSIVRSDPIKVDAVGTEVLTSTPDIANARIEFASGAVANVTASRVSQKAQRKFRMFQQNQYLSIDFGSGEVNLLTKTGEMKDGELPLEADAWSLTKGDALLSETQSFVKSVLEDRPPIVSGEDGLVALELAERIMNAIAEHKKLHRLN